MTIETSEATGTAAASADALDQLWYTRCPVPTASGIAQNRRWLHDAFSTVGVQLESIRASADRSVRESHFRHNLPGSFREGGNVPPIWARSKGQQTTVVAITWVDEAQLVLVRDDSDIQTVNDLHGRRLGLGLHSGTDLVDVLRAESLRGLLTALKINDVRRDEVEFVDLPAERWELRETDASAPKRNILVEAVLEGTVDAVFVKGAGTAAALARGLRPIADLNTEPDPLLRVSAGSPRPVTVDTATLREHPELVDRYLAVLLKTAEWATKNPDGVVSTVAAETGAPEADVRQAFGPKVHLAFEPKLDPVYIAGLADQKDFLLAEGFIPADFDIDGWIDPAPLARAHQLAAALDLSTTPVTAAPAGQAG